MMIRLFAALKIPDEIKKKIFEIRNEILPDWGKYKWEKEDKIHLTLKFIGEVGDKKVPAISNSLNLIEKYPKLNCRFSRFGFFFDRGIPKILWIGLSTDDSLYKLVNEINLELEKFSIPRDERKFNSHITLLRLKNKEPIELIKRFEEFSMPEINFIIDTAILIKSELLPQTSKYTKIKNYKLN
jgi:RNA 2',3'-cyclic 3'-phosphodiesterase